MSRDGEAGRVPAIHKNAWTDFGSPMCNVWPVTGRRRWSAGNLRNRQARHSWTTSKCC